MPFFDFKLFALPCQAFLGCISLAGLNAPPYVLSNYGKLLANKPLGREFIPPQFPFQKPSI